MKAITIISAFAVLWLLSPLAAQEEESEYRRETAKRPKAQADCSEHPFGAGCMGFGLGPVISSDGKGVVYGAGANFTYFLIDRLGAGVHGGAIFGSGYQDYSVGPGITYYIGPFGGYLLTPSLTATRHFLRGDFNGFDLDLPGLLAALPSFDELMIPHHLSHTLFQGGRGPKKFMCSGVCKLNPSICIRDHDTIGELF